MSAAVRACATREMEAEADLEPPAKGGGMSLLWTHASPESAPWSVAGEKVL